MMILMLFEYKEQLLYYVDDQVLKQIAERWKVIKSSLLGAVHLMDGISSGGGGIVPGDADQVSQQSESISSVADELCLEPTLPRSLLEFSESPVMSYCKNLSFSHMLTLTGPPQSITEWLVFWEKDPVEILLNLGFGAEEPDVRTKIPPRFLSGVSVAKGFDVQAFLEVQKKQMDIERPNLHDDTKLGGTVDTPEEHDVMQRNLDKLKKWPYGTPMEFNKTKCKMLPLAQAGG
ncbi:Coiled-coil domain-containing protein 129 [Lonchura striata]|uniref:Coiled-coil domain-containing protein 129 n=1 Tax=Lonchura striata TaxID=40157 RepID=A0A218UW29_9PASE|nr:Coiled-coil domain-containing protein 129 [Lonchura striata domestica]